MDASGALWNELNYERRQNFTDPDIGKSVWDTEEYRKQYVGVLGSATAQQVIRKNTEAWRSFFALNEQDEANGLPGYWGNEQEGRELRTYIRTDQYTVRWGDRSTIEITVGSDLKDEYDMGHRERLTLEVRGKPTWSGDQGRLELYYDELSDQYRAIQPVTTDDSRQDSPVADETAALDIGANNIVACTTTTGQQYLYEGRELFDRLYDEDVSTVYVGDLTDVLDTHWSVRANQKMHNFWAFRAFINRLACTAEEYGITVEARPEAWTSQTCPQCDSTADTTRHQDTLTCSCGFEGHADLTASETFLRRHEAAVPRPMARPVCLTWDDHRWSASPRAHRPNEEHTHPQVTAGDSA